MRSFFRARWPEALIVSGVVLLVLGLSGWESRSSSGGRFARLNGARSSAGFPIESRAMMGLGVALLAIGVMSRGKA